MPSAVTSRAGRFGTRSIIGVIEELLLVPSYSSRWAPATIAAHRGMALPLQLVGQTRRWSVGSGSSAINLLSIGRAKLIEPLLVRLLGELPQAQEEARRMLWSPESLASPEADLVAAEV